MILLAHQLVVHQLEPVALYLEAIFVLPCSSASVMMRQWHPLPKLLLRCHLLQMTVHYFSRAAFYLETSPCQ